MSGLFLSQFKRFEPFPLFELVHDTDFSLALGHCFRAETRVDGITYVGHAHITEKELAAVRFEPNAMLRAMMRATEHACLAAFDAVDIERHVRPLAPPLG